MHVSTAGGGTLKKYLRMVIYFILTNSKFLKVELEGLIESCASAKLQIRVSRVT